MVAIYVAQTGSNNPFNGVQMGAGNSVPACVDIDFDGDLDCFFGDSNSWYWLLDSHIQFYRGDGRGCCLLQKYWIKHSSSVRNCYKPIVGSCNDNGRHTLFLRY